METFYGKKLWKEEKNLLYRKTVQMMAAIQNFLPKKKKNYTEIYLCATNKKISIIKFLP